MIGEPEEFVLSSRTTVTVAELDGYESGKADILLSKLLGAVSAEDMKNGELPVMGMVLLQVKVYGICSIRSINGTAVEPLRGIAKYSEAAKLLSVKDSNELQKWAQPIYMPDEEDAKKEESAQP